MYSRATSRILYVVVSMFVSCSMTFSQQPNGIQQGLGNQGNQGAGQGGLGNQLFGGNAQGGAAAADFDSLIDLITSTVESDSWMENGTGDGDIQPFFNGVFADAEGTLRFAVPDEKAMSSIAEARPRKAPKASDLRDVRQPSALRSVSLPRLEATIRAYQLRQKALPEEMLTLAGLQRIEFLFVVPPTDNNPGDLLIAGPAGDWRVRPDGKIVAVQTTQPVVRLDDLLTLWRRHHLRRGKPFGVSINPRQANLANVQQYVAASKSQPLEPSQRRKWLDGLRDSLGKQDVEFFGLEPDSHVARVLLVADYHMKLIGMGLAQGVDGVQSYLKSIQVGRDGSVPPMTVLRWWFAMNYEPFATDDTRTAYQLRGQGVKVLSENELLAARGRRIHTGQSEDLNKQFANSFTENFDALREKYPLYTELQNIFDLTMMLEAIDQEGLLTRANWQPTLFANPEWLPLPRMLVPHEVETVINHRVVRRKHVIAGISGGVWVNAKQETTFAASAAELPIVGPVPTISDQNEVWWWDAK